MPTIKEAIAKNQAMKAIQATQPQGETPMPTPASLVSPAAPQDLPLGGGLPQRGMFPANMVLASDRSDSSRMFRGPGMRSATFPFPPGQITSKLTVTNNTSISSTGNSKSIELLVNSIPNPVQNVLNLIQGFGINISVDNFGNVFIVNTMPGTPSSSNAIELIDNFTFSSNPGIGVSEIGELKWHMEGNSGIASGAAVTQTGGFPNLGTFNWPNDTSASSFQNIVASSLAQGGSATDALWPLFDYPSWTATYTFRLSRYTDASTSTPFPLSQTSLYVGMMSPSGTGNTSMRRPAAGAWLRFDTDPTSPSIGDSTFWFECVANDVSSASVTNVQGNTFDTMITPVEFAWYTLVLTYTAVGTVDFSLTGTDGSSASASLTMPTFEVNSGGFGSAAVHAGLADIFYGGIITPFGIGSKVTFSGTVSLDGPEVLQFAGTSKSHSYFSTAGSATGGSLNILAVGYPAVVPFFSMGNDTQSTPVQNRQIACDYFKFIWNPAS